MKKTLTVLAVIFGLAFVAMAIFYWVTPADMLPAFVPGYDAAMATPHIKHGVASLVVGLALLIYAWFASTKKVS
jgi:uncharacterized membrane-anchored protein YitT (DUF2179 family)